LLKGKTIGIDATTLEANAAMKTIVRRDTEESYTEYLKGLAGAAGGGLRESAADRWQSRQAVAETAWRADRADVRARLRDRRFATLVRAREAKRAEEAAVTSSGMQPSAAAQDDDRCGDAASVAGRGGKSICCSLAAYLS